jgi:predicted nucleic acid-binding protein
MAAVSNTSPLSNLAIVGRLELLSEQFGQVFIPPAVHLELKLHPNASARKCIEAAMKQDWLRIHRLTNPVPNNLAATLHSGEAEAIALALELKAELVLLDESDARSAARRLGLPHTGVLGVLRKAKETGRITSLRAEIARLRAEAHFFIHRTLERELLISAGEESPS